MLCIGTYGGAYGETTLSKTGQTLSNVLGELIYVFVDLLPIFVDKIKDFESSKGNLLFSKPNNFTLLSKYIILCKAQGNVLRAIYKIRNQREQHSVFMTLSTKSFLGFDNNGFKDVLPVKCPMQQVICNSAWSLLAASVTCDFEAGLIKASHEQFPEGGHPNGCSFHFKKCNKEQLVKLGVHELLRDKLLRKGGLLDILMVIPHSDIETKGKPKFYLYLRFLSYNVLTSLYDTLGIDYIRHVLMGVMNSWSEFEKNAPWTAT
jgi:hypothetical protein